MVGKNFATVVCSFVWLYGAPLCFGQGGGYGAGAAYNSFQNQPPATSQQALDVRHDTVKVTGSAEIAVKPEGLRLVFAVAKSEETSQQTAAMVKASIERIRAEIANLKVADSDVVEDFIVMRPRYEWHVEKLDNGDSAAVATEKMVGYQMQTNLHVMCKNERQALDVIDVAFANGVSEVISFDYWHSELDAYKRKVTKQALEQAKLKSEVLLSVFDRRPKLINVADDIQVSFPQSLYKTIVEPTDPRENNRPYNWRNMHKIFANRPKVTFYAGSQQYSDSSSQRPPMKPEIFVRAQITLVHSSPARDEQMEIERIEAARPGNK